MTAAFPDDVLRQHIAILGKTGSGKTSTSKLLVEQVVAADSRVCILDPIKSDWWGLTLDGAGMHKGLPFAILGGPHGALRLDDRLGAHVGKIVAEGVSHHTILDMADFGPGGLQRFFTEFAPALLRHMRGVLYLVIEEAHEFAPKERAGFGGENLALHWAKKLATAGRSKGIRLVVCTQRVQSLHNAVLGSCETIIAHRLTTPADQKPVADWLGAHVGKDKQGEIQHTLSSLPTGTGWLVSGEAGVCERIAFPKFSTFDNAATPEEDDIDTYTPIPPIAPAIEAIKVAMAALERDRTSVSPSTDRSKNGSLPVPPDPAAINEAERRGYELGYKDGFAEGDKGALIRMHEAWDRSATALGQEFAASFERMKAAQAAMRERAVVVNRSREACIAPKGSTRQVVQEQQKTAGGAGAAKLGAERRPLAVLARAYPRGMTEVQWSVAAGMKRSGGNWGTYKSRLKTAGMIERQGDMWFARSDALIVLGSEVEAMPAPGAELVEFWISRISGVGPMLRKLAHVYPGGYQRADLATSLDMSTSSGTFGTYLSRLRSAGLIEDRGKLICAARSLMEAV